MAKNSFTTVADAYGKEREPVILKLDVAAARALGHKYRLPMPADDRRILLGLHRQRVRMKRCPEELRRESENWLEANS